VSIKRKYLISRNPWIMGRMACMGKDVLNLINKNHIPLINVQKGRVDYLTLIGEHNARIAQTRKIVAFIERDDIKNLILQQEVLWANSINPPIAFFMDSFSELTDQLFYNRKTRLVFLCELF